MNILRGERDHVANWVRGKPNAVSFVPPQGLEIKALNAQRKAKQQQADQRPCARSSAPTWQAAHERTALTSVKHG